MVVEVILDGATDGPGHSLDAAVLPAIGGLGAPQWRELLDPGVPVGSETAIASLLGWRPAGPVDRAVVEAAARGLEGPVKRVDLLDDGHRLLVFGASRVQASGKIRVWPPGETPPRVLDPDTVVVGALGAATGLGSLMGARIVVPPGATGRPGSDLSGKRRAALDAIAGGARRVVVHVGCADEAAHRRDSALKRAELARADRELVAPLLEAVQSLGGRFAVGPDHGCDPATGQHTGGPVPWFGWSPA